MQLVRAESDFIVGVERETENVISASVGENRTLMLTDWDHLLSKLNSLVKSDGDEGTLRSIAELQGVVDYEALNAFYAPSVELSDLDDDNREKLRRLVYDAIEVGEARRLGRHDRIFLDASREWLLAILQDARCQHVVRIRHTIVEVSERTFMAWLPGFRPGTHY